MALLNAKGKATLLRVNQVGDKFGPATDNIQAEVILKLDSEPTKAFGFELRTGVNQPVRQGMLDLLRDGFNQNWVINIDYEIAAGKTKGKITRVWLTKDAKASTSGGGGVFQPIDPTP
jgi:hypothetical protein